MAEYRLSPAAERDLGGIWKYTRRHMIYFRITDYGIAITRILHERMDAPHHL
jgi:plasmid stabilization system protein ParE